MKKKGKTMLKAGSMMLGLLMAGALVSTQALPAFAVTDGTPFTGTMQKLESSSAEDALTKAKKLNEQIAEEGFVLLKNENSALPLKTITKVNLLGKNWVNPAYGGSGSSSFDANSGSGIDVIQAMKDEGFEINEALINFYKDNAKSGTGRPNYSYGASDMITGETPWASYTDTEKNSLSGYDANIVMVTRVGGEGYEVSSFYDAAVSGRANATEEHYLMLDDNEKELIKQAKATTKPVVLVINAAQPLELHDEDLANVDAVLWVGLPGSTGFAALPRILKGTVNPSGRTTDTYAKDFYSIPAFQNFSLNEKNAVRQDPGNSSSAIKEPAGNAVLDASGASQGAVVTYEEGIYVGYRYFETRAYEEDKKAGATANEWWEDNVRYPFGYGLSYTTFTYEKVEFKTNALTRDGKVEVEVTVKNTGSVAGKEVVEFYYSAPYTVNEIEKSHVVLGDFAKTKTLAPDETEVLKLAINVEDMASYDWDDFNNNNFYGYELDEGDYTFYVGANAHAWYNAPDANKKTINLAEGITYEMDIDGKADGNDNQFDDVSMGLTGKGIDELSRADFEGTMPEHPTAGERTADAATVTALNTYGVYSQNDPDGSEYDEGQPWYVEEMPTQATTEYTGSERGIIRLIDLLNEEYGSERWQQFMNQFTVDQLVAFVEMGFFNTWGVPALGIPESKTPDGPFGFVFQAPEHSSNRCYYVSPCIVASTFNKELAHKQGETLGEDGAWMGYNGIYAPGVNIHRTPFSGRNFEYYSEDATLAATMCREVVAGMQSKGVMPFIKHFALNDQEQDRNGVATFATEQAMREIYLRAFQWAVEDSGALGIMSSFNRVGTTWAGCNYALLTNVLRKEWGFKGTVITDWGNGGYMNLDQMIRGGGDLSLANRTQRLTTTAAAMTPTHVAAMRQAAMNICYSVLHTNEMTKLVEYNDLVGGEAYMFAGNELTIDFHSETYEAQYQRHQTQNWWGGLGDWVGDYNLTYELTTPDSVNRAAAEQGNNNVKNPPVVPEKNISIDAQTGIVTVNGEGLEAGDYSICVSIKLTPAAESSIEDKTPFYIGQSAFYTIHVYESATDPAFQTQFNVLMQQVTSLNAEIENLNAQIADLQATIAALQGNTGSDNSAEVEALKATVATLQSTVETLQAALKTAQDEIAALKNNAGSGSGTVDTSALENKIKDLETKVKALEDEVAALKENAGSGSVDTSALENKIKELEEKVKALEEAKGETTNGGCGSVIGIGSAIAATVMVLGCAAFVLRKKEN